jgi:sigma-B regulation protein RsbU (phosphoserine phosphatase)
VSGDYYDFLPQPPERLTIAVGDVSGKGISAALLMATIHSAMRAYSLETTPMRGIPLAVGADVSSTESHLPLGRTEVSPALLVGLLNQQLYRSTPIEKYATLFVGNYDGPSRRLTYTNAGHLPPVLIGDEGNVRRLECGGTVVGLFAAMSYEESSIELQPGDLFLAFSDGITEPENDFGEFGEERLIDLVRDHRHEPLPRIAEVVTAAVDDWIGGHEQPDDLTLVLARAR